MVVHSVYFYLKPDLSAEMRAGLEAGMRKLAAIEHVRSLVVGTPVPSERAVVDGSYGYALIITFDDPAGQEAYQRHPDHIAFATTHAPCWTQVKVYDCTVA